MSSRLPDEDRIIEKTVLKGFDFSYEIMHLCHAKLWYRYPENQYFRFDKIHDLLRELQTDLHAPAQDTTVYLHQMDDGHREIYTMLLLGEMYVTVALQDNYAPRIFSNEVALNRFYDLDRGVGILQHYQHRAAKRGYYPAALGLRCMVKFLMNLPGDPSVWVMPDTNKTLSIAVIWKDQEDNRDALIITIVDPVNPSF